MPTTPFSGTQAESLRAGHILGIRGGAQVKHSPNMHTFVMPTEFNYHKITAGYINEKLKRFKPTRHQAQWQQISDMFDTTASETHQIAANLRGNHNPIHVNQLNNPIHVNQLKRYQDGQPVHICSGWEGHHIGITLYKGYIIITNRGDRGELGEGTIIYKMDKNISTVDLKRLQQCMVGAQSYEQHQDVLSRICGEKVAHFPQKAQEKDTCSYVNKQASTEGALCLLVLDSQGKLNDENIRDYAKDNRNREAYKEFTRANRSSEIERIIELMQDAAFDGKQRELAVMANIACRVFEKYVTANSGHPQKNKEELDGARALMMAIEPYKRFLSTDNQATFKFLVEQYADKLTGPEPVVAAPQRVQDDPQAAQTDAAQHNPQTHKDAPNAQILNILKNHIKKEIQSRMPKQDLSDRVKGPAWGVQLVAQITQAQDSAQVGLRLKAAMNKFPHDEQLATMVMQLIKDKYIDKDDDLIQACVQVAIEKAKDIDELKQILKDYPGQKIKSPSGSEYNPQDVLAQLNNPDPRGVTSALGLRAKVIQLKREKQLDQQQSHSQESIKPGAGRAAMKALFDKNPEVGIHAQRHKKFK